MEAFAYLRVSGKGQLRGDGFPRQLLAVQNYAKVNKIQICQVFREEGVTGALEGMNRKTAVSFPFEKPSGS